VSGIKGVRAVVVGCPLKEGKYPLNKVPIYIVALSAETSKGLETFEVFRGELETLGIRIK
jgi:hypothetical protein